MNHDIYVRLRKIANEYDTYKVSPGDSYSKIAKNLRTGVTADDIARANPRVRPTALQIGQTIRIPRAAAVKAKPQPEWYGPSEAFLDEIRSVESSGGVNLYGDKKAHKAYSEGPYQIREVFPTEREKYLAKRKAQKRPASGSMYIDDVNDMFGTKYTLKDRLDEQKSREMTRLYLLRYGRNFYKQYGRYPTNEEMYGMHNGGGIGGHNSEATAEHRANYNSVAAKRRTKRDPWISDGAYNQLYNLSTRDPQYKAKLDAINRFIADKKAEYINKQKGIPAR
jgi:LysM repeat protein